jgi:hypothetical protein
MIFSGDERTAGWGCSKCKGEGFEDGDEFRSVRNCDSSENKNIAWTWMPTLDRCPWSQIDEEAWLYLQQWAEFERFKVLPIQGLDLLDQPALIFEAFMFLYEIKADIEKTRMKKEQKEQEKQMRKMRRR